MNKVLDHGNEIILCDRHFATTFPKGGHFPTEVEGLCEVCTSTLSVEGLDEIDDYLAGHSDGKIEALDFVVAFTAKHGHEDNFATALCSAIEAYALHDDQGEA